MMSCGIHFGPVALQFDGGLILDLSRLNALTACLSAAEPISGESNKTIIAPPFINSEFGGPIYSTLIYTQPTPGMVLTMLNPSKIFLTSASEAACPDLMMISHGR